MMASDTRCSFWTGGSDSVIAATLAIFFLWGFADVHAAACGETHFGPVDSIEADLLACQPGTYKDEASVFEVRLLRSSDKRFKNPAAKDPADGDNRCFKGASYSSTCDCKEYVSSVLLLGATNGILKINAAERANANKFHCSAAASDSERDILEVATSPGFVSTLVREWMRPQGGQGSCHGSYKMTSDLISTGHRYKLSDVLNKESESYLAGALLGNFLSRYGKHFVTTIQARKKQQSP